MTIALIVIVVLVGIGAYVLRERRAKAPRKGREEGLRAMADRLGFSYERDRNPFGQQPPLDQDVQRVLLALDRDFYGYPHMLRGDSKLGPVMVFDVWHGDWGSGKQDPSDPFRQTLAAFHLADARLPTFSISLHRRVQIAPGDIDLPEHPEFSDRYLLRGPDEERVRELFGPRLIRVWERLDPDQRWAAAGAGSSLVIYREPKSRTTRDREVAPDELEEFLQGAEAIASQFRT